MEEPINSPSYLFFHLRPLHLPCSFLSFFLLFQKSPVLFFFLLAFILLILQFRKRQKSPNGELSSSNNTFPGSDLPWPNSISLQFQNYVSDLIFKDTYMYVIITHVSYPHNIGSETFPWAIIQKEFAKECLPWKLPNNYRF